MFALIRFQYKKFYNPLVGIFSDNESAINALDYDFKHFFKKQFPGIDLRLLRDEQKAAVIDIKKEEIVASYFVSYVDLDKIYSNDFEP